MNHDLTGPGGPSERSDLDRLREDLREAARLLRETDHVEPDAQRALAGLVAELTAALEPDAPPDEIRHLADSSAQLVEALHRGHGHGPLAAARDRLVAAAARAEAQAPVATDLARRLVDALAALGI